MAPYWKRCPVDADAIVPTEREFLIRYIVERLRVPVQISDESPWIMVAQEVCELWKSTVEHFQVDCESHHIDCMWEEEIGFSEDVDFPEEALSELRAIAINIRTWYGSAVEKFFEESALVWVTMADEATYHKHFPPPKCNTYEDLKAESSRRDVALLLYGLDARTLDWIMGGVLEQVFSDLIGKHNFRVAVDCMTTVGVVGQIEAHILAVEFNRHTAHAYPVVEQEVAEKGMKLVFDDSLQGMGRRNRDKGG